MSSLKKQMKKTVTKKRTRTPKKKAVLDPINFLPSGLTTLNLTLSTFPDVGYARGRMINIVGGSSAGKSILAWLCLAEAIHNTQFKDYEFHYDDTEDGGDGFDVVELFGKKTYEKVERHRSETIQDFHYNWLNIHKKRKGKPFIYIVDSVDGLEEKSDQKKLKEQQAAHEKGDKGTGSYGMGKAKYANSIFRNVTSKLKNTSSLLICVSQTKKNPTASMFENPDYRACGSALEFFSWQVIWLVLGKQHTKQKLMVGVESKAKISKNRSTGKRRTCHFPIYYDIGPDNIQSCIEFLLETKYWKKNKAGIVNAEDFGIGDCTVLELVYEIEREDMEPDLFKLVEKAWNKREAAVKIDGRKRKYI